MKSNLNIEKAINGDVQNLYKIVESLNLESNRGHGELESLIQLNYSQIDSTIDPISNECRGLVLDLNTLEVVCRGFGRFFNHGQKEAAPIDWSTAKVQEKLDGSLILCFWYNNRWNFATRGSVGAYGNVGTNTFSFNEFVKNIWCENKYQIDMDPQYSYMFELTSPENRIVVAYPDRKLTLLAVINKETGLELDIQGIPTNIPKVKSFNIRSFDDAAKMLETSSPMELEGFVVVDANFNRVKIKSPQYVACHHMRDKCTPRGMLNLIRIGEDEEFLSYFPEHKLSLFEMKAKLNALDFGLIDHYNTIKYIDIRKEFALQAIKSPCSGALFAMKDHRVGSIREFLLHNLHEDKLLELLGY
jgi:hypothetical protein